MAEERYPLQSEPDDLGLSDELVDDEKPEDDLFSRVILHNKLVTPEQVDACRKMIAGEVAAGQPRRALVNVLISEGMLSPKAAGAVEVALRKNRSRTAVRKKTSAGRIPPKLKPLKKKAPVGDSRIMVAVKRDEDTPAAKEKAEAPAGQEAGASDERLKAAVKRVAPGRIYPEMLRYIGQHKVALIDPGEMARGIGEPETAVIEALRYWSRAGVLRKVGECPFNFSPAADVQEDLKVLNEAWADPSSHARVMGFILAAE